MKTLEDLLAANRQAVVRDWFSHILETYPPETATLWKKGGDPFHSPVTARSKACVEAVVDYLAAGHDEKAFEAVMCAMEELIRVRAVQNFSPSQAAGFIFLLKKTVRERLWHAVEAEGLWARLLAFESRIDGLALVALDLFAKCRERFHEIKLQDLRREYTQLLKRARLIVGVGEGEPAP